MNTTQNSSSANSSRFAGLRGLGRGIAVTSAVAVMGIGSMSAADASAAGVAQGVRYAGTSATAAVKAEPTSLAAGANSQLVVRNGKVERIES